METLAKMSPKSLDEANRIVDDLNAKTGSPNSQAKNDGETLARAGLRNIEPGRRPHLFGNEPPGLPIERESTGRKAEGHEREPDE